jgi:hypothetical protein
MGQFEDNVCRIVGHEWASYPDVFANVCKRCHTWKRQIDIWTARNLYKVERLELGSEAIYDKDIPDKEA